MNDNSTTNNAVLGRGIAFPLQLQNGTLGMNAYESQVAQSIRLLLSTAKGERVMRPDFGAGLERLAFEPNNPVTAVLIQQQVKEALLRYEPRIEVLGVFVSQSDQAAINASQNGEMLIEISYRVKTTDSTGNLVYPFYIERGVSA